MLGNMVTLRKQRRQHLEAWKARLCVQNKKARAYLKRIGVGDVCVGGLFYRRVAGDEAARPHTDRCKTKQQPT